MSINKKFNQQQKTNVDVPEYMANPAVIDKLLSDIVPKLRQYACAFSGSVLIGDELVTRSIEAAANGLDNSGFHKVEFVLFKCLISSCNSMMPALHKIENAALCDTSPCAGRLAQLPPNQRHAFLLQSYRLFSFSEMQCILGLSRKSLWQCLNDAFDNIIAATSTNVLIIDNDLKTAEQLGYIARELGHRIVEVAKDHPQAFEKSMKRQYGLLLANIERHDGKSTLDLTSAISERQKPFIIFIATAREIEKSQQSTSPWPVVCRPFDHRKLKSLITTSLFFHDY